MDYLQTRELYHHGIKGQKWGVRRYQYEDGTLTAEGRKRYGKGLSSERSGNITFGGGHKAMNAKYRRRENRINARYDRKIAKIESQRARDNDYYDKNPNANTLWDPETGKTMKDWGNEYYDKRTNAVQSKKRMVLEANKIKSDMNNGAKVLRVLLEGPFANENVARLEASGMSALGANVMAAAEAAIMPELSVLGAFAIAPLMNRYDVPQKARDKINELKEKKG